MSVSLSVHPVSSYESREIEWLWSGRVPLGKVTLVAGDPGLGKSFITLDIAARVSSGKPMPGETEPPVGGAPGNDGPIKGGVLLLSAEDDPGDTLRPRLEAMGAHLNNVHMVPSVVHVNENVSPIEREWVPFQLDKHARLLDEALMEDDSVRLVVIDPISAYMGDTDSHNNAQVRAVLGRLAQVASRRHVAIVCVTHLNKGGGGQGKAVYRAMGSLAFTAAARIVHQVSKDPNDPKRRLMVPVKANITGDVGGMAYTIAEDEQGRTRIVWEPGSVHVSADDLESDDAGERVGQLDEAVAWLEERLKGGPVAAKVVIEEAKADGLSERTLRRAKATLKLPSAKIGDDWCWTPAA